MNNAGSSGHTGPLEGVRVLELGSTVAGPLCTRLLADFGAETIKVEAREGDAVRNLGKHCRGVSLYAASMMRNKRNVSIDLRTSPGQDLVRRLARRVDVLVENFRPGTLERWGLSYECLSEDNPGLVLARISGFGQSGPYSQRAGYGVIAEAVSGLRELNGDPDRPPARMAIPLTDYITGLYAAYGVMLALRARERSGRGQIVDAALYEGAFSFTEPHVMAYDKLGTVASRLGTRLPDSTPNNLYATSDGHYIQITAIGESVFRRLCACMGQASLAEDPRFVDARSRPQHEDVLDGIIGAWTQSLDLDTAEKALHDAGVPAARIYNMADAFSDPHFASRDMLVAVDHPELGKVTLPGVVPKLSAVPGRVRWAGQRVGQDTRSVLHELAGLGEAELDALAEQAIIYCAEDPP